MNSDIAAPPPKADPVEMFIESVKANGEWHGWPDVAKLRALAAQQVAAKWKHKREQRKLNKDGIKFK